MVLERTVVQERLKELDQILQELLKYQDIAWETLQADLSQRWIIERGLIAAASVIFDIADHILAGHFGFYAETYEGSLEGLREKKVISEMLYDQIRGLGGFRNILIHRYVRIDPQEVAGNLRKGLSVFPQFAAEILSWLDSLDTG
jgi:uncharacterized protein YutE (UPF0331/DUF86 family)